MSEKKVALVTGALGINGRAITEHLDQHSEEWNEIYAVSRKELDYKTTKVKYISVNLEERQDVENKLGSLRNVTHVFFAAYKEAVKLADFVQPNLLMLKNVVEVIENSSPTLKHVALMEGAKWYGFHLGPLPKVPAKEDDPRTMPPNFYYDQEDYLRNRQSGKKWSWSAVRPNSVCGYSYGTPMDLMMILAVYGTICKELNLPFRFPGNKKAYSSLLDVCDTDIVAKSMIWSATTPACANQAYNISNGDVFRWCQVWPKIAAFFNLSVPDPPYQSIDLTEMMADKAELWTKITKRYQLQNTNFENLVSWKFQEYVFGKHYDLFLDVGKARRAGFKEMNLDSGEAFVRGLNNFRKQKIIP